MSEYIEVTELVRLFKFDEEQGLNIFSSRSNSVHYYNTLVEQRSEQFAEEVWNSAWKIHHAPQEVV